ncbi:MAG TPA: site-specific integrase, partial [Methanobacterium sp.]|nr:site-specific integrase [Methanobacterium sp.]
MKKDIRKGTQKSYKLALKQYCEYTSKTPEELIGEAEDEEEKGIKLSRRKIQSYILGYRKMLEESGKAPKTINLYISAVRSFYDTFDIILPKIKLKKGDICLEANYGKLLTKEDLLKLANAAAPRERALIYMMALSGMAQNEARNITITKFLESASEATDIKLKTVYDLFDHE